MRQLSGSRPCRTVVRHEVKEDFRTLANTGAAEENQEKIDRGNVADPKTKRHGGEVALAEAIGDAGEISIAEKEKSRGKSFSFGNGVSESFCLNEKEKVVAESFPGVFPNAFEQEKEAQIVTDSEPIAGRISGAFREPQSVPGHRRKNVAVTFSVPFAKEKGRAGDHLVE